MLSLLSKQIFEEVNNKPTRCKVAVYRFRGDVRYQAAVGVAYFAECSQNNTMWNKMPHIMLAKVAEALALRKAYPQDLSGLYTSDEMSQAETVDVTPKPEVNQFNKLANAANGEMEGTLQKVNEEDFTRIKKELEECGSVSELEKVSTDNKAQLGKLSKYANNLFIMLKETKQVMLQVLDPEGQEA